MVTEPLEDVAPATEIQLVGQLRAILVGEVGALGDLRVHAADVGAEKERVSAAVEQGFVGVEDKRVTDAVLLGDEHPAVVDLVLPTPRDLEIELVGPGAGDILFQLHVEDTRAVRLVVRGREVHVAPVVNRTIGRSGNLPQRPRLDEVGTLRKLKRRRGVVRRISAAHENLDLPCVDELEITHVRAAKKLQARGQRAVHRGDRHGRGRPAVDREGLGQRIVGGHALGAPVRDIFSRHQRVCPAGILLKTLGARRERRGAERPKREGKLLPVGPVGGGLADEALLLVNRGEAQRKQVADQRTIGVHARPETTVAVHAGGQVGGGPVQVGATGDEVHGATGIAEAREIRVRTAHDFDRVDIIRIDRDAAAGGETAGRDVGGGETADAVGAGRIPSDVIVVAATVAGGIGELLGAFGADFELENIVDVDRRGIEQLLLRDHGYGPGEVLEFGRESGAGERARSRVTAIGGGAHFKRG